MTVFNLFFKICTLILLIYIALMISYYDSNTIALIIVFSLLVAGFSSFFIGTKKSKHDKKSTDDILN